MDLSMDTLHLQYPLVFFGSGGSALTLPLFRLSPRIIMLCHCSSTMTKDHFLLIFFATMLWLPTHGVFFNSLKRSLCATKLLRSLTNACEVLARYW